MAELKHLVLRYLKLKDEVDMRGGSDEMIEERELALEALMDAVGFKPEIVREAEWYAKRH